MKTTKNTISSFRRLFGTTEQCRQYLSDLKWQDGYSCKKCNGIEQIKGDCGFDKRCKSCGYNESVTSGTIFHAMKMPIELAFEMVHRISVNKKGISSVALSREYGVNQKTAYNFKRKVQTCMKSSENHPLTGIVHVDEFVFGGVDKGCPGRSAESDKLKICIAVEIVKDKNGLDTSGRMYALPIENYSCKELTTMFTTHISKDAQIVTDKWAGYSPLKAEYKIEQIKSENRLNFPTLHTVIMNLKSWIRCIHHSISKNQLQKYINEFCFRFNRRTSIDKMHLILLKKMAFHLPCPLPTRASGLCG
jgi:transposase-like protein